jgi:hypothetical protein
MQGIVQHSAVGNVPGGNLPIIAGGTVAMRVVFLYSVRPAETLAFSLSFGEVLLSTYTYNLIYK